MPPKKKKAEGDEPSETTSSLDAAIKRIAQESNTQFVRLGAKASELRPVLPTGIFALDHFVLGSGGLPRGRIVELFGEPSNGKSTLAMQAIANTQRLNPAAEVAYLDLEHSFDPAYAQALGVNTDRLLLAQPTVGEEAMQAALDIIETGAISLLIVDSVANIVPRAELEGQISDAHMGLQARLMGKTLRKQTAVVSRAGTCLVYLNQTRATMNAYGASKETTGGKALKFYSSVRLEVIRTQAHKRGENILGNVTKIKGVKNKTATPFKEFDVNLIFGSGFDNHGSIVDLAEKQGVIQKTGAKYVFPQTGEEVNGRFNACDLLRTEHELCKQVEEQTLLALGHSQEYIARAMRTR